MLELTRTTVTETAKTYLVEVQFGGDVTDPAQHGLLVRLPIPREKHLLAPELRKALLERVLSAIDKEIQAIDRSSGRTR